MSQLLVGRYQEDGGWVGAISLGFDGQGKRQRIKRKAKTKTELKEKLIQVVAEREAGLKSAEGYTVASAVNDWLTKGLKGRDDMTITTNRILAEQHVIPLIGAAKLKELTADDVDEWLEGLTAKLASRTLTGVHSILKRSIRQAQARDKVLRNVAELVTTPKGKPGRPSKAMTFDQAMAMLEAAKSYRLHGYVVVSLLVGIRTEEARALLWSHVVASHVRRAFKAITRKAGLGENWTPRELRHSFVSIMSDNGVPIENIADLVGHASTAVTEEVYRHQLKPVITKGAETMNTIFSQHNQAKSA